MTTHSVAGTTIGISSSAPATYNTAGYDALTFTEIGEITNLGEFGQKFNVIKHNPIKSRGTVKKKGSYDNGTLPLKGGYDSDNAGQILLKASASSDNNHFLKVTFTNGDIVYMPILTTSFIVGAGGVDDLVSFSAEAEITEVNGVGIVWKLAA